jgi:MFS family permease
LNWPVWRRDLALTVIGFHSFIIGGQTPLLASAFTSLSNEFSVSLNTLAYLVGAYMLSLGLGSVFFAPTAVLYGKRIVYLVALLLWLVGSVVAGASKSFNMLLGARIIMGFGGSPTEALPSSSIAEIYFLHERAYRLGIYTLLLLGGKNLVPMVAAFIIQDLNFNWLFWILTMIVAMNLVLTFLFVPETFWFRPPIPLDKRSIKETELAREARANSLLSHVSKSSANNASSVVVTPGRPAEEHTSSEKQKNKNDSGSAIASGSNGTSTSALPSPKRSSNLHPTFDLSTTSIIPNDSNERSDYFEGFSAHHTQSLSPTPREPERHPTFSAETDEQIHPHVDDRPSMYNREFSMSTQSIHSRYSRHLMPPRTISMTSANTPKKTFVETLKIYSGRLSQDKWWMVALRPFVLYAYPAVLFSTFVYAFAVVWLIVVSEVISTIFAHEPYNFPATSVGLLYISTFLGGCLGSAVAGRVSDIIVRIMSRRNGGIYEPEFRLVMMIPVMIFVSSGMMGFGWSSFDKDLWIVPAIFLALIGCGCSMASTIAITYVVDSYKTFASEALVTLNFSKNVLGFLFSLFVVRFFEGSGGRTTFVVFGCIEIFICLFGIPVYIYGKRMRYWTDKVNMMRFFYVDSDE